MLPACVEVKVFCLHVWRSGYTACMFGGQGTLPVCVEVHMKLALALMLDLPPHMICSDVG